MCIFVLLCASVLVSCTGAEEPPARVLGGGAAEGYPLHREVTATVFWIGEPSTSENSFIPNDISAWDDRWMEHYGGYDDPYNRIGYYPAGFTPKENPFYFDLPYNDFHDSGKRKSEAARVVPWANERAWGPRESMLKNRWIKLIKGERVCYAQWEDAGPFEYDDAAYVFGDGSVLPKNKLANHAGMDVSPAVRDCLAFEGLNNDQNKVDWQFVEEQDVPPGPWKEIVTTSQVCWDPGCR